MLDPELEHGGERLPLSAWADRCGFTTSYPLIAQLRSGMSLGEALQRATR